MWGRILNPVVISRVRLTSSFRSLLTMQLKTTEVQSLFSDGLNGIAELFEKYKFELRIAGGAVRDLLSGKRPEDVDFTFQTAEIRRINNKGEKHGTITARLHNENFEVTTLQVDVHLQTGRKTYAFIPRFTCRGRLGGDEAGLAACEGPFSQAHYFLVKHRRDRHKSQDDSDSMKPYTDYIIDVSTGEDKLLAEMSRWSTPRFPASKHDLRKIGITSGKEIGTILQNLRDMWKKEMNKAELLSHVNKT
uniref:Poly A polymerase head domain-containing protein n=2 Tax=Oncorhynchus tshawytscha TaxID=74940 RepID=A0A8C8HFE8_ONCTS